MYKPPTRKYYKAGRYHNELVKNKFVMVIDKWKKCTGSEYFLQSYQYPEHYRKETVLNN